MLAGQKVGLPRLFREKVLGDQRPDTGRSLVNLAALYNEMGDYAEAARDQTPFY